MTEPEYSRDDMDRAREKWIALREMYGRDDERALAARAEYNRIARNPQQEPGYDEGWDES